MHLAEISHEHTKVMNSNSLKFTSTWIQRGGKQCGLFPLMAVERFVKSAGMISGESAHDDKDE